MGLHLCFELSLPGDASVDDAAHRIALLHERASTLSLDHVSAISRFSEVELDGPWPIQGLRYNALEDVAHVGAALAREELYRRRLGFTDDEEYRQIQVPARLATVAIGFGVHPGRGSEPASFGLTRITAPSDPPDGWWWHCCCKTQYASVLGEEHLVRCHDSLVAVLDHAGDVGFDVTVRDETGYWESRDRRTLCDAVEEMNRVVARFAGKLTDSVREAGGDSSTLKGSIFEHPDFERLEGE